MSLLAAIPLRYPRNQDEASFGECIPQRFNRQLDAQTAERVLREELQRAVILFPPKGDVMAYAWTETDPTPGSEEMISLPDGSKFLIYSPKTKQMQTEKQYDISRQKPAQPGKGLNVDLSLELERGTDGRAR